jgi:hypothetical protein
MNLNNTKSFLTKCCHFFIVNCNDTFYLASADAEQISVHDLEIFLQAYHKYGYDGVNALCALHRKEDVLKQLQTENYFKAKEEYKDYDFSD